MNRTRTGLPPCGGVVQGAGQGFALSPALPPDQMARVLAGPPIDMSGDELPDDPLEGLPEGAEVDLDVPLIEERSSRLSS